MQVHNDIIENTSLLALWAGKSYQLALNKNE